MRPKGTAAELERRRRRAVQLLEQLGDRLPLILDAGETTGILASTVVKLDDDEWTVRREGVISEELIRAALKDEAEE